jgi:uncharacterized protein (TIGR03067 family)
LAALGTLTACAPAPFPKAERGKQLPEIRGLWRGNYELLITADRLTYNPDTPQPIAYELRLDESARPRAYSIHLLPDSTFQGNGAHGVYKVEGDTLTLSYRPAFERRPTAVSGPGRGIHTEVYKRVRR